MHHLRKVSGFTLLELVITLCVAAIVVGFAIPSVSRMLAQAELRAGSSALSVALAAARLRAVERRSTVSVCPKARAGGCRGDNDWSSGWLVFDDPRRSGRPSTPRAVIEVTELSGATRIHSTAGRTRLTFRPDGSSAGSNVTLSLCHPDHAGLGRQIVVSNVGRARSGPLPARHACPASRS